MPDEIVNDAAKEFLNSGGVWAAAIILMGIVLWYVDRRASNERKEYQAALDKAKAEHLADVKKANEQFGPVKDQMASLVVAINSLAELVKERRR